MDLNKVLQVSTFAGKIMLESGAETYRVEETICKICTSFGAEQADSFVIPTGIMVSISNEDEAVSLVKRVTSRGVDLNKIDKINDLARKTQMESLSINDFYKQLVEISKGERYSDLYTLFWAAISGGSFALLFGADGKDFISATLIGLAIKIVGIICRRFNINEFFINSLCGAICAFLAIIFIKIDIGSNLDKIIIGSIMLLVPGLTITNAIRDTIAGDLLSGMTKALEAFLVAVSIAIGTGGILSIFINALGGV
ncbi:threonine/serine ThrE exporter family protein [Clostridium taeniosporum]|uniref:Threonine/serine exporter n=1 Tax=Clostridium taeniosporum TaxID=394958 RepID=A0A1D7XIH5_9CLOT|nr:threonine/serine exporter family protein [Clostridium taeniosporum]AOR23106.1 threonine/serine exporter [Clostridium taeniosporum]